MRRRRLSMLVGSVVLSASFALPAAGDAPSGKPAPACGPAIQRIVPLSAAGTYALEFSSRQADPIDAHVTLFARSKSFAFDVRAVQLLPIADRGVYRSTPVFFSVENAEPVDGALAQPLDASKAQCRPAEYVAAWAARGPVEDVARQRLAAAFEGNPPVTAAAFVRDRPLPCAQPYRDAKMVRGAQPDYPFRAIAIRAAGTVKVKVAIGADGSVSSATVYASSGNADLDASAVKAAASSEFEPELFRCEPRPGSYLFTAQFNAR